MYVVKEVKFTPLTLYSQMYLLSSDYEFIFQT